MEALSIQVRRGFEIVGSHDAAIDKPIIVGRDETADIMLDDKSVSRCHASIVFDGQSAVVVDHSRNGIQCEGRRIESSSSFEPGTSIDIGPFTLVLGRNCPSSDGSRHNLRKRILGRLIEHIDLKTIDLKSPDLRPRVEAALERIAAEEGVALDASMTELVRDLANEALGLGPLERLLADEQVSEIMVVDPDTIYVERKGCIEETGLSFISEASVRTVIDRIIAPIGRRVDELSPMVDARLADGSRVNAIIPPLALRGAAITIRRFSKRPLGLDDLIAFGSLTEEMANLLKQAVAARANIVISGGTGSGKTTLLGALAGEIPGSERIVTIEDAAELRLPQRHVIPLESRPSNNEGRGQITIRDLVRNALRMRPDRIVVGECRGGEALDMLQAMNTGHDGSLTTLHANSAAEAVSRLETLALMSGIELPARAIRDQIASAIDIIVQQTRMADGSRLITSITEVSGIEENGEFRLNEIYKFVLRGESRFAATGWLPRCLLPSIHVKADECDEACS